MRTTGLYLKEDFKSSFEEIQEIMDRIDSESEIPEKAYNEVYEDCQKIIENLLLVYGYQQFNKKD